jgi:hypothetical protein
MQKFMDLNGDGRHRSTSACNAVLAHFGILSMKTFWQQLYLFIWLKKLPCLPCLHITGLLLELVSFPWLVAWFPGWLLTWGIWVWLASFWATPCNWSSMACRSPSSWPINSDLSGVFTTWIRGRSSSRIDRTSWVVYWRERAERTEKEREMRLNEIVLDSVYKKNIWTQVNLNSATYNKQ